MYLEELAGRIRRREREIECGVRLERGDVPGWLETVCGFSNASGGTFFIGVEDRSLKLIGFTRRDAESERSYFTERIAEHVYPEPQYDVSFLRYEAGKKDLYILRIDVEASPFRPVLLRREGVPSVYIRRQGFTDGASYDEIVDLCRNAGRPGYDLLPTEEDFRPEDFRDLAAFGRERERDKNILSVKALTGIGFITGDRKLSRGALLFGDGYRGERTGIRCVVYSGFAPLEERVVSVNTYRGNITGGIAYMRDYVRQRMNRSLIGRALSPTDPGAYPESALLEGIVFAAAHRDYEREKGEIRLSLFRDRLEIRTPGGPAGGKKILKSRDLSGIVSKRRNGMICAVLARCGAEAAEAPGLEGTAEAYRAADGRHKPYICADSESFTLVLPDLTYEEGLQDSEVPALEYIPGERASKHDRRILGFCLENARTAGEIAAFLGISDSTYLRRTILGGLVASGCLNDMRIGTAKAYRTDPGSVRLL